MGKPVEPASYMVSHPPQLYLHIQYNRDNGYSASLDMGILKPQYVYSEFREMGIQGVFRLKSTLLWDWQLLGLQITVITNTTHGAWPI